MLNQLLWQRTFPPNPGGLVERTTQAPLVKETVYLTGRRGTKGENSLSAGARDRREFERIPVQCPLCKRVSSYEWLGDSGHPERAIVEVTCGKCAAILFIQKQACLDQTRFAYHWVQIYNYGTPPTYRTSP